jgi:hypothetical protein
MSSNDDLGYTQGFNDARGGKPYNDLNTFHVWSSFANGYRRGWDDFVESWKNRNAPPTPRCQVCGTRAHEGDCP